MKQKREFLTAQTVFPVLRAATVVSGLLGTALALFLAAIGIDVLRAGLEENIPCWTAASIVGLAAVVAVSVCAYAALTIFLRLCGRLARGSTFTAQNVAAMRRIARCFLGAGAALTITVAGLTVIMGGMLLPMIYLLLLVLICLGAALLCEALGVLTERAAALQQESELTI